MEHWVDEETGTKMCEPNCVDELLFDIWAIGCNYDGCHNTKDLKALIDELVDMANKARECLWSNKLFGAHGSPDDEEKLAVQNKTVDFSYLHNWFIDSVGAEEPVWTEGHIEELLESFIVIPKEDK